MSLVAFIQPLLMAAVIPSPAAAHSTSPASQERVAHFLRQGPLRAGSSATADERYALAFADLNGDGRAEAIVHVASRCGSGGCLMLVLTPSQQSYRLVGRTTITNLPIRRLPTRSRGWNDIGVFVRGGGILPGYHAALSFGGRRYPSNPSVKPARKLAKAAGTILIGEDATIFSLHH